MAAVVLLSGGQDSTTCLFWAKERFDSVTAVVIDYSQRHIQELEAAKQVAEAAGVDLLPTKITGGFYGNSPLVSPSKHVRKYDNVDHLPGGLEDTFVPGRNIVFLALAAGIASVLGATSVVVGLSAEDFGGYPDCTPTFVEAMEVAISAGLPYPVKIEAPLMHLDKKATVGLARSLPGCWEALKFSRTCYEGRSPACGKCHSCLLRLRGFHQAGYDDPLEYECSI